MTQWNVSDVMATAVPSVRVDTPYRAIADLLVRQDIGHVPVVDTGRHIVGVVSVTDLVSGRAHGAATARDVMHSCPLTLRPQASLASAIKQMDEAACLHLYVTDDDGLIVGVVTRPDLQGTQLRNDDEIQDDVIAKVLWHDLGIDPLAVQVEVKRGVVTLTGLVNHRRTAEAALALTRSLPGVLGIVDRLRPADGADSEIVQIGRPRRQSRLWDNLT